MDKCASKEYYPLMMTKKDYYTIARALNMARQRALGTGSLDAIDLAIDCVSDALAADNPRFMPNIFGQACRR